MADKRMFPMKHSIAALQSVDSNDSYSTGKRTANRTRRKGWHQGCDTSNVTPSVRQRTRCGDLQGERTGDGLGRGVY